MKTNFTIEVYEMLPYTGDYIEHIDNTITYF